MSRFLHRSVVAAFAAVLAIAAQTDALGRFAPIPVVVIVGGGSAPLSHRWIDPCRRIQYERLVGIETVAIEVLCELGLSRHPIHERALEDQRPRKRSRSLRDDRWRHERAPTGR